MTTPRTVPVVFTEDVYQRLAFLANQHHCRIGHVVEMLVHDALHRSEPASPIERVFVTGERPGTAQ